MVANLSDASFLFSVYFFATYCRFSFLVLVFCKILHNYVYTVTQTINSGLIMQFTLVVCIPGGGMQNSKNILFKFKFNILDYSAQSHTNSCIVCGLMVNQRQEMA